jgi:hypothetical protein
MKFVILVFIFVILILLFSKYKTGNDLSDECNNMIYTSTNDTPEYLRNRWGSFYDFCIDFRRKTTLDDCSKCKNFNYYINNSSFCNNEC